MDIVTVICRRDLSAAVLQARSIRLFFDSATLGRVLFICNEPSGELTKAELGPIANENPNVQFISSEQFLPSGRRPLVSNARRTLHPFATEGWFTQQIIKIAVGRVVESDAYLLLDAKNHFIKPASRATFMADDGRGVATFGPLSRIRTSFQPVWRNCYSYFGLDPEAFTGDVIRPQTPFVVHKNLACDLMDEVELREGAPFSEAMLARMPELFEFFLIQAFAVYRDGRLDRLYRNASPRFATIFHSVVAKEPSFNAVLERAARDDVVTFGVHWAAVLLMSSAQRRQIAEFWKSCGLVTSQQEAFRIMGLGTAARVKLALETLTGLITAARLKLALGFVQRRG